MEIWFQFKPRARASINVLSSEVDHGGIAVDVAADSCSTGAIGWNGAAVVKTCVGAELVVGCGTFSFTPPETLGSECVGSRFLGGLA